MKEKDVYKKMKEKFCNQLFLQRIESRTGLGIPDVHYCISSSRAGWIELKVVKKFPKKGQIKVPFRPGQLAWIRDYQRFSSKVFLFLYVENSLFVMRGTSIMPTYSRSNIHVASCYDAFWNKVDWIEVLSLL